MDAGLIMEQRKCRQCEAVKPIKEFASAGVVKGIKYWRRLCNPCYTVSKKPRKIKLKKEYHELKSLCECAECGNNDIRVLDFDHLDASKKLFNVGEGVTRGYSMTRIKEEIEKCQVLCSNCHRIKTWEERNTGD